MHHLDRSCVIVGIFFEITAFPNSGVHRVWMKEFISDLGVITSASGPMKIFRDNTGAIALAKESRFHKRTKHIKRRFNSIRDLVKEGDIEICKIHMDLNVGDPLTKPLPRAKHDQHHDSMGVKMITM